jgi:hypothetical protein
MEERMIFQYLEDSDEEDSEYSPTSIEGLKFYQKIETDLKHTNLRILSKTVTGSVERSDSMESVIEEIVNVSDDKSVENVLGLNDKTLEFYDRNKQIEFRNSIRDAYIKTIRFFFFVLILYGIYEILINTLIIPLIND